MRKVLTLLILTLSLSVPAWGQIWNFPTRRVVTYTSAPATCTKGDLYFDTSSNGLFDCTATNTWTSLGGGSFTGGTLTSALFVIDGSAGVPSIGRSASTAHGFYFTAVGFGYGTSTTNAVKHDFSAATAERTVIWPNSNLSIPVFPQTITLTGPTAARTWTVPDVSDTIAFLGQANAFTGANTFAANTVLGSATSLGWGSSGVATPDTFFTRAAAATFQYGAADAASAVAQTIQMQSVVAGTTNVAGANAVLQGSRGTGTGAGGTVIIKAANAGNSGTTQNTANTIATFQDKGTAGASAPDVTFAGTITPSQTAGIVGTTTNNNANAGSVGELITGTTAPNTTTASTGVSINVGAGTNISLTAGDWDCSAVINFTFGATTSITNLSGGISTTTGALPTQDSRFDYETAANVPTATATAAWVCPVTRILVASTTNVFLVASATFTVSTCTLGGTIRCRRVR